MNLSSPDALYQLAFAQITGKGFRYDVAVKLMEIDGMDERTFFNLSESKLEQLCGSKSPIFNSSNRSKWLEHAEKEIEFIERFKVNVTYFTDDDYPYRLTHNVPDAPLALYNFGDTKLNSKHIVAIVGTRNCTNYGVAFCDTLVNELSELLPDTVIVSGLAYGTDVAAHRAALKYNLPTVGVLAHGLNKIYPEEHTDTAKSMIQHGGMLITEYTSHDKMNRGSFLARNRIIAALADCVVVVESAYKGGSISTAHRAADYSRDVFVLPGRITDKYSQGCIRLISNQIAVPITSAKDLIKEMRWDDDIKDANANSQQLAIQFLNSRQQQVFEYISTHDRPHTNNIARELGLAPYEIYEVLDFLEEQQLIMMISNGRYDVGMAAK